MMSNWGEGYKQGFRSGALRALQLYCADKSKQEVAKSVRFLMTQIDREKDGSPSMYAVANHCCGGVDAHDVGC